MSERETYDAMRRHAKKLAEQAASALDSSGTTDGMMAPHVAKERVLKLRRIASQINALCDFVEVAL
jgi:hypothetical protein